MVLHSTGMEHVVIGGVASTVFEARLCEIDMDELAE